MAAWWWDIDLLGEPDVAVFQSKERVVGSQPHLQEREGGQEEVHDENVYSFTTSNQPLWTEEE